MTDHPMQEPERDSHAPDVPQDTPDTRDEGESVSIFELMAMQAQEEAESGEGTFADDTKTTGPSPTPPKKAGRSIIVATALICLFCTFLSGSFGVMIGLRMSQSSLTFDAILRRLKANTADDLASGAIAEATAACAPSVVSIAVSFDNQNVYSTSSGVILAEEQGETFIVCCAHGVEGFPYVQVTTNDNKAFAAELVGLDFETDLALIKIKATGLRVAIPQMASPVMGEAVVAMGNPLGNIGTSASFGIVSRAECEIVFDGIAHTLMKLDCAVNPGNSGGGVFDMEGHLLGIVCAKVSVYENVQMEGLAFAIPSQTVYDIISQLKSGGFVQNRLHLGLDLAPADKQDAPLLLNRYIYDDLAEGQRLGEGDVLLHASTTQGHSIELEPSATLSHKQILQNLRTFLAQAEVDDEVHLTVEHTDGSRSVVVVKVKLATQPGADL